MNLTDKAKEFACSIMSTNEFSHLKQAKKAIDQNRVLRNQVDQFTKKQMETYTNNSSGKSMESAIAELNRQFQSLSKNPEVDTFLKASKQYDNMMQKVYKIINDIIESGLKS